MSKCAWLEKCIVRVWTPGHELESRICIKTKARSPRTSRLTKLFSFFHVLGTREDDAISSISITGADLLPVAGMAW